MGLRTRPTRPPQRPGRAPPVWHPDVNRRVCITASSTGPASDTTTPRGRCTHPPGRPRGAVSLQRRRSGRDPSAQPSAQLVSFFLRRGTPGCHRGAGSPPRRCGQPPPDADSRPPVRPRAPVAPRPPPSRAAGSGSAAPGPSSRPQTSRTAWEETHSSRQEAAEDSRTWRRQRSRRRCARRTWPSFAMVIRIRAETQATADQVARAIRSPSRGSTRPSSTSTGVRFRSITSFRLRSAGVEDARPGSRTTDSRWPAATRDAETQHADQTARRGAERGHPEAIGMALCSNRPAPQPAPPPALSPIYDATHAGRPADVPRAELVAEFPVVRPGGA